jgi:hypothetical protein
MFVLYCSDTVWSGGYWMCVSVVLQWHGLIRWLLNVCVCCVAVTRLDHVVTECVCLLCCSDTFGSRRYWMCVSVVLQWHGWITWLLNVCVCCVAVTRLDQIVTESDDQRISRLQATVAQVTPRQYISFETKVSLVMFTSISYFRERIQSHGSRPTFLHSMHPCFKKPSDKFLPYFVLMLCHCRPQYRHFNFLRWVIRTCKKCKILRWEWH